MEINEEGRKATLRKARRFKHQQVCSCFTVTCDSDEAQSWVVSRALNTQSCPPSALTPLGVVSPAHCSRSVTRTPTCVSQTEKRWVFRASDESQNCCARSWAPLGAQLVVNPPAMWETRVRSLGWEDPLEKGTAAHSSILAWRMPWTVKPVGSQRVRHD